jgi:phosphinothricin acetyltransferase
MQIQYEPLSQSHAKEVIDIFNYYVENTFAAFPEEKLPYEAFGMFLKVTAGYPAYAIKDQENKKAIGFCFLRPFSPFPVFKETTEIAYFLSPDHVGKGLGKKMLSILETEARKMGIQNILASINSLNDQSMTFHSHNGFIECGRLKNAGKKHGKPFDLVWMQKEIN